MLKFSSMCSMSSQESSTRMFITISRVWRQFSTSHQTPKSSASFTRWISCKRISVIQFSGRDKRIWRNFHFHSSAQRSEHQFGMRRCIVHGHRLCINWFPMWKLSRTRCISSQRSSTPTKFCCLNVRHFWLYQTASWNIILTRIDSKKCQISSSSLSCRVQSSVHASTRWRWETVALPHSSRRSRQTPWLWWVFLCEIRVSMKFIDIFPIWLTFVGRAIWSSNAQRSDAHQYSQCSKVLWGARESNQHIHLIVSFGQQLLGTIGDHRWEDNIYHWTWTKSCFLFVTVKNDYSM